MGILPAKNPMGYPQTVSVVQYRSGPRVALLKMAVAEVQFRHISVERAGELVALTYRSSCKMHFVLLSKFSQSVLFEDWYHSYKRLFTAQFLSIDFGRKCNKLSRQSNSRFFFFGLSLGPLSWSAFAMGNLVKSQKVDFSSVYFSIRFHPCNDDF